MKRKHEKEYFYSLGARIRALRLGWHPWADRKAWVRISDMPKQPYGEFWLLQFWPGNELLPARKCKPNEFRKLEDQTIFQFYPFTAIKAIKKPFNIVVDNHGRAA